MVKKVLVAICCILVLVAACKEPAKAKKVFKGYVIWEKEYTTFTNCETGKAYWIEDPTGEIAKQHAALAKQAYQEVYFEFEADLLPPSTTGVSSGFDNIIAIKKVVNAQATPPQDACKNKDEKPVFSCFGSSPEWTFGFGRDIKFTAEYPNDTLVFFPLAEPQIRDSTGVGRVFYYSINNENFQHIQVIITEQPCMMNKKWHRFTSKVIFGGVEYKGCANIKIVNNEEYSNTNNVVVPNSSL